MDGSGLEVQVGWRWLPAFSMHSKLMPVPNEGSLEKFLSKPENRETECQENVGVASTSAALNLEVMEVSEERNISPLEEDFSKTKTRESTAEEPESNLSSSISSCLDCGDVPGLWPASMTNDLVNILVIRAQCAPPFPAQPTHFVIQGPIAVRARANKGRTRGFTGLVYSPSVRQNLSFHVHGVRFAVSDTALAMTLPNDMENYIQYRVMGSVSQVRMKSGCIPTKFECQPDRRKRTAFIT
ncbi:hypothetical protein EVAR_82703_1 [Eumeta japonica]|uniref:Uncharacterized protein n=1 Tax=Eumeta variegata TaxID=151549 RepID=A0A4C1YFW2_EUMVA|nr:hypothetical protein EVAR_82703_1 [Eumeta japonica]